MCSGSTPPSPKRQKAYMRGLFAEHKTAWGLRLTGWRILKRRYRTKAGEIDLIARRGNTVAFIEVKARNSREAALEAITTANQNRIIKAARIFVSKNPEYAAFTLRFDVVVVRPWRWPEHICNAFQAR